MNENVIKSSQNISEFIKFLDDIKSQYEYFVEQLKIQDDLTQDLLHKIEFEEGGIKQRNKMATTLKNCRKDRRYYKDRIEEYQPIINFIENPSNSKTINNLKQTLGEVRKQENYHLNRFYKPRVLETKK